MTPPAWMQKFSDAVAAEMKFVDMPAPIGCHVCEVDEVWELSLFAANTEVVGGHRDGRNITPVFHVEVVSLLPLFEKVERLTWQNAPVGRSDELGAHLVLEGRVQGQQVCLQILARAPKRFAAGRQILVHENAIVETW